MGVFKDITGQRFGRLLAISHTGLRNKDKRPIWVFRCDCGTTKQIANRYVVSGNTSSCGCLEKENLSRISGIITHGKSKTSTYKIWTDMKKRCLNKRHWAYSSYGGRGITVATEWNKFENFLADMGGRPKGLTLDRIDNNAGYSKQNCRWTTRKEQGRNKRNNKFYAINGLSKTIPEWAEVLKINPWTLYERAKKGKPLNAPVRGAK